MTPIALSTANTDTLTGVLASHGAAAFRAAQLRRAAWQPFVTGIDDIRQLPAELRERLREDLAFSTVTVVAESEADAGRTVKLLCRLADGQTVETVAMETPSTGRVAPPLHGVRQQPGGLRGGLPVLRHRADGADAARAPPRRWSTRCALRRPRCTRAASAR